MLFPGSWGLIPYANPLIIEVEFVPTTSRVGSIRPFVANGMVLKCGNRRERTSGTATDFGVNRVNGGLEETVSSADGGRGRLIFDRQ